MKKVFSQTGERILRTATCLRDPRIPEGMIQVRVRGPNGEASTRLMSLTEYEGMRPRWDESGGSDDGNAQEGVQGSFSELEA